MLPNNLEYKILISIHIVATRTIRARKESIKTGVSEHTEKTEITESRGTQREHSSKPLKHSIVKRVLVLKRWIWAYFFPYKFFICSDFLAENLVIRTL